MVPLPPLPGGGYGDGGYGDGGYGDGGYGDGGYGDGGYGDGGFDDGGDGGAVSGFRVVVPSPSNAPSPPVGSPPPRALAPYRGTSDGAREAEGGAMHGRFLGLSDDGSWCSSAVHTTPAGIELSVSPVPLTAPRLEVMAHAQMEVAQTKLEVLQALAQAKMQFAEAKLAVVHAHVGPEATTPALGTPSSWLPGWWLSPKNGGDLSA